MIQTHAPGVQRADSVGGVPIRRPVREILSLHEPTHAVARVPRIRVRVAHSVPLIRSGISAALSRSRQFEIDAADASEVGYAAADVLVADVDTALRALASGAAGRSVLIVAQDDGEVMVRKALEKGVRGFLLHTCGLEELTMAVETLSRGGTAFAPWVANRIVQSFASQPLTDRELEVLQLLVQGSSDKDIARKLTIAPGTAKTHVRSILTKLGAARRSEAAAIAQRRGLARLDSHPHSDLQRETT